MTAEQFGNARFFSLSQVEYGINAADFDLRAYIFGHTVFGINKDAVFYSRYRWYSAYRKSGDFARHR
jgi:hypothetical protein